MIVGIGIDIVDIDRIERLMNKYGERFFSRVFTHEETAYCLNRYDAPACIAARFAAKEAAFKALSAGRFAGIGLKEIAVSSVRDKPELKLTGKAREWAEKLGVTGMHLSISHDRGCAAAMVILEKAG
jgi:holo-[acyl-carrier protein] synthase